MESNESYSACMITSYNLSSLFCNDLKYLFVGMIHNNIFQSINKVDYESLIISMNNIDHHWQLAR